METVMKTVLITLALALGTTVAASPASAEPAALARVAVSTAGLDLTTDKGLRALDLRILHAASEACGTRRPPIRAAGSHMKTAATRRAPQSSPSATACSRPPVTAAWWRLRSSAEFRR
jgi:UrcA family protein